MATPTLKQLRYFEAVARHEHFGRAAEDCAVTQPALSMQVQELERILGVALLERRAKGVRLTEVGREIARRARVVLLAARDLTDFASSRQGLLAGALRLGVIPTIAPYLLPGLLQRAAARFPDLELRLRESQTKTLVGELIAGKLDVLLAALPIGHPDLAERELFEDRFLLATPAGSAAGAAVHDDFGAGAGLAGQRLLLLEEGHCFRDQALAVCRLGPAEAVDAFGASSLSTLAQMVANGMGVTLLPEMSLAVETRSAGLRIRRFPEPEPARRIGLVWRKSSPRSVDILALGELVAGPPEPRAGVELGPDLGIGLGLELELELDAAVSPPL